MTPIPTHDASFLLEGLNPAQREAVLHDGGPALVLAGAGSGKTRVITHRIAHLIRHRGVPAHGIVAVTFTNKAAGEMRERVERLLQGGQLGAKIGTFHALCLRILRRDGAPVGLEPGFQVYDRDDQLALVRRLLREHRPDASASEARGVLSRISRAKNALQGPEELIRKTGWSTEAALAAEIYPLYEAALRRANAADFDDLLLKTLELFREHPELGRRYAGQCRHLLVDEYQDTNRPQYLLVRHLASEHGNLFVVGDEDQSIYRFRGAEIRNILDFEKDHPDARIIRLEQNYRSTGTILEAAGAVIRHNRERKGKTLWTDNPAGERIQLFHAPTDRGEAAWVAGQVHALAAEIPYEAMAVLYRTNAQSRQFEEIFRRERIPYQVVGGMQFYERKEVKDLLAYLRLAVNPRDDVSFRRVLAVPPRGIGDTTLRKIEEIARGRSVSLYDAARHAVEQSLLSGRAQTALVRFLDFLEALNERAASGAPSAVLDGLVRDLDYAAYLRRQDVDREADRMENVQALVSAAVEYEGESDEPTLQGFLDRSALVSDADGVGARPGVTLMTIHCAKGLEYDVVFLAGLDDGVFPHARSLGRETDLEEERRLCYVAMTRARRRLFLSRAWMRRVQGVPVEQRSSRFLAEIPQDLLEEASFDAGSEPEAHEPSEGWGSSAARAARAARRGPRRPSRPRTPAGPVPEDGFAVGRQVVHPTFGPGAILDREGEGRALKLTIDFRRYGLKKILPHYTQLKAV